MDDGPASIDDTIALLRAAHAGGVRRLAATPHMFLAPWSHRDPALLREAFARTREALAERAAAEPELAFLLELRIDLGAESYVSSDLLAALEDREGVLTLNGSRYLLVELPIGFPAAGILAAARRIRSAGLRPVIAHVERYLALEERHDDLLRLRAEGCVLQVNASTLLGGRSDSRRRRRYLDLLREQVVQIVASDAHDAAVRRPLLGEVLAALEAELPAARVEACLHENARRILDDEPLDE